ncbi:MAG: DUF6682 family protein, partial [Anderseniella sp.]|nr:DUF6682 family protein [Anderseniella sp.]
IDRKTLDDQRRIWHNDRPSPTIAQWMFDPRDPRSFMVYPPATTGAQLEVLYSELPQPHALTNEQLSNPATTETLRLPDHAANMVLDYVLFRAYSKDAEYSANASRAAAHYQAVLSALGVMTTADAAMRPGVADAQVKA